MAKLVLTDIANLSNPSAVTNINANNAALRAAFDNTLSRDGTLPNQQMHDLDMNSKRILNLSKPTTPGEPLRLADLGLFTNVGGSTSMATLTVGANFAPGATTLLTVNGNTHALPPNQYASTEYFATQIGGPDGKITALLIYGFGNGVSGFPGIGMYKSNGTNAAPTAVNAGDILGVLDTHAYGTTAYFGGTPQLRFVATQTWTDTAQGGAVTILTNANGTDAATSVREVARFDQSGALLIGALGAGTLSPDPLLVINKNTVALPTTVDAASSKWAAQFGGADGTIAVVGIDAFGTGNATALAAFDFRRANGTAATSTPLKSGDIIGILGGIGKITTGYSGAALQIRYLATQDWTNAAQGSALSFWTTPNGAVAASSVVERVRIDSTGFVGLGNTSPKTLMDANANTSVSPALVNPFSVGRYQAVDGNVGAFEVVSYGSAGVSWVGAAGGGTAASPTATPNGTSLTNFGGYGYNGTSFQLGGAMVISSGSLWSGTNQETSIVFLVTAHNATTYSTGMILNSSGGLSIGTASDPGTGMIYTNAATFMLRTKTSLTNGAAAQTATMTNGPTAGNPTKWLPYDDNGTTRYIPAW